MAVGVRPSLAPLSQIRIWRPYWWAYPALVFVVLSAFVGYGFYAILDWAGSYTPYLSPFYSPLITIGGHPLLPVFYIAWVPLGFRATCYYYRKAYYRSFFLEPPACAVPDRPGHYTGETRLPLILQNAHRYFWYLATIVLGFLWYDTGRAFDFHGHFGVGVGSVLMLANVLCLTGYTLGCHALRSLVGGGIDCYSCSRFRETRHGAWRFVSILNGRHALWAWISLFSVSIADGYIRLLIHGVFADPRWIS
jgi:hypothetical protein